MNIIPVLEHNISDQERLVRQIEKYECAVCADKGDCKWCPWMDVMKASKMFLAAVTDILDEKIGE